MKYRDYSERAKSPFAYRLPKNYNGDLGQVHHGPGILGRGFIMT